MKIQFLSISFLLMMCTNAFAQGFSSFSVEGSLLKASIKDNSKGVSVVQVIVNDKVDLKNLKVKYNLWGGCSISETTPLNNDFSSPKRITINKEDGTSKDWLVYVCQLVPTKLPLTLNFSDENLCTAGIDNVKAAVGFWTTYQLDLAKKSPNVRLDSDKAAFYIAFDGKPKQLSYSLVLLDNNAFAGELLVETSLDGLAWVKLVKHDVATIMTQDVDFSQPLKSDVRFVRWSYPVRNKQNVVLNNIKVSK